MGKPNCIVFISLLFLFGSFNIRQQYDYTSEDIRGKWVLTVEQVNYPSLKFNRDSTAIFNSLGDTIYRYRFYIDKKVLVLMDVNGNKTTDKILKLDRDSLIFETLAGIKEIQRYKRQK